MSEENNNYIKLFNDYMKLLYKGFKLEEVVLFCYIVSLSQKCGYCSYTDKYFMNYLNCSKRSIQDYLLHLEREKLIIRYYDGTQRQIEPDRTRADKLMREFAYG